MSTIAEVVALIAEHAQALKDENEKLRDEIKDLDYECDLRGERIEELEELLDAQPDRFDSVAFHDIASRAYSVDPRRTENDLIALGLNPHAYRAVS